MHIVPRSYERKGLRAVGHIDATHYDRIRAMLHWGWPTLLITLIGLIGGTFDVRFNLLTISWLGARRGENILIEFKPPGETKREVVLSAHYDSKTELLDHYGRTFFVRRLPLGVVLTALLGLMGWAEGLLQTQIPSWPTLLFGPGPC